MNKLKQWANDLFISGKATKPKVQKEIERAMLNGDSLVSEVNSLPLHEQKQLMEEIEQSIAYSEAIPRGQVKAILVENEFEVENEK